MKNRTKILFIAFAALISSVACHAPKKCGCPNVVTLNDKPTWEQTKWLPELSEANSVTAIPDSLLWRLCCPDSGANTINSPGYKEMWKRESIRRKIDTSE